jgi:sporulation protein YlmC with PRC-barrel domain
MATESQIKYSGSMLKRPAAVKILIGLSLALLWAPPAHAQGKLVSPPLKARQLNGMKVENSDGQKVGTVRNLVLDVKSGRLRYVVIGSGGFFGVRANLKLAPARAMTTATAKRQTLAVNATSTQWSHAPVFKSSDLVSLADPNHAREIARNFEMASTGVSSPNTNSVSTTARGISTNSPVPELKFASDLIGMRVVNQKQEKIGEVLDLLVCFGEPRPAFAIISSGRLFHREHRYAVPLTALTSSSGDSKLTLDADAATLQQAPPFNQQVWDAGANNGQIFRYSTPED